MKICMVLLSVLVICLTHTSAVYQDMTWVLDMNHISYHPTFAADQFRFKMEVTFADTVVGTNFFAAYNTYSTVEHMGTHIDAPYHFAKDGLTMDEVPLEDLIGPLVKIDITERVRAFADANITIADLKNWEKRNGEIPDGSFIIMSSGWDRFYGDNIKYVGTEVNGGETHSPGFSERAAEWLKNNRKIKGIGVDTVSCDAGNSVTRVGNYSEYFFPAHQILQAKNVLCIENLHSVDKVPECGAKISALPIVLINGTGTQARVFAEWYPGMGYMTTCGGKFDMGSSTFMKTAGSHQVTSVTSLMFSLCFVVLLLSW